MSKATKPQIPKTSPYSSGLSHTMPAKLADGDYRYAIYEDGIKIIELQMPTGDLIVTASLALRKAMRAGRREGAKQC